MEEEEKEIVSTLATLGTPTKPKIGRPKELNVYFKRRKRHRIWFTGKTNPPYPTPITIKEIHIHK